MSVPRSVPRRRLVLFAGTTTVLLLTTLLAAGPAPALTPCSSPPAIIPEAQLVPGTLGTGLTTLAGTTPMQFTYEIVGTIPNGFMIGLDAIVIHITGPASFLSQTGGVFFGMSGSPAYVNGKLAGAVSAVFDDPTFGALTPAAAMLDVVGAAQGPSAIPARTIVPTPEIRRAIARVQGTSAESVTGTFTQLPVPLAVSGLGDDQIAQLQGRLDQRGENFVVYSAGSAAGPAGTVTSTPFAPGEPLGVAIAYGDASYYATGTATFTCGDHVAAFGHPFFYDAPGAVSLGLSGAEGLMMVKGAGWPGYRFALLTEPRGTIVQDRFAGIAGIVGQVPASVPIESELTNLDDGSSRIGTTEVIHSWGWWLEEIVWSHLWANFAAVFGHFGGGSSSLDWTIDGTTADGPFTVSNHWLTSDEWDATGSMWRLISAVDTLQFAQDAEVTLTDISTSGWITKDLLEGKIGRIRLASTTQPKLRTRGVLKAHPGDAVTVEVSFDMIDGTTVVKTVEFKVPKNVKGIRDVGLRGGRDRYRYGDTFQEALDVLNGGEHPDDLVLTGLGRYQWPQGLVVRGKAHFTIQVVRRAS
jgi:hypothetical protein